MVANGVSDGNATLGSYVAIMEMLKMVEKVFHKHRRFKAALSPDEQTK
jgi:hypothetical protein